MKALPTASAKSFAQRAPPSRGNAMYSNNVNMGSMNGNMNNSMSSSSNFMQNSSSSSSSSNFQNGQLRGNAPAPPEKKATAAERKEKALKEFEMQAREM